MKKIIVYVSVSYDPETGTFTKSIFQNQDLTGLIASFKFNYEGCVETNKALIDDLEDLQKVQTAHTIIDLMDAIQHQLIEGYVKSYFEDPDLDVIFMFDGSDDMKRYFYEACRIIESMYPDRAEYIDIIRRA